MQHATLFDSLSSEFTRLYQLVIDVAVIYFTHIIIKSENELFTSMKLFCEKIL